MRCAGVTTLPSGSCSAPAPKARPDSDVDLLVTFEPDAVIGFEFVTFAEELESLFGRRVDLLVKDDAVADRNEIRRDSILANVEVIYAA